MSDNKELNEDNQTEKQPKWYQNKQLRDYGIFLLILIVLISVISLFILTNRNSWNKGLSEQIKTVLEKNDYRNVTVNKTPVEIKTPLSTSCAAYKVNYSNAPENETAVIVRITTLYGPVAAVYLYHESSLIDFVDFTSSDRVTEKQNKEISKNMQIDYWKKRIAVLLTESTEKNEGGSN